MTINLYENASSIFSNSISERLRSSFIFYWYLFIMLFWTWQNALGIGSISCPWLINYNWCLHRNIEFANFTKSGYKKIDHHIFLHPSDQTYPKKHDLSQYAAQWDVQFAKYWINIGPVVQSVYLGNIRFAIYEKYFSFLAFIGKNKDYRNLSIFLLFFISCSLLSL